MNKTLPIVAVAALAFAVLTAETAQAQRFGNRGRNSNNNQRVQRATRGPIMQRMVDFNTVYGNAQRRGLGGLPNQDSALRYSRNPINQFGTLNNNRWTQRTTPGYQRIVRPQPTRSTNGLNFIPQTRPIPNAATWVRPNYYHGGLLP